VILVVLVFSGAILGLLIGLGVLMLFIGGLNSVLTDFIWDIQTKTSAWNLLIHGIVLFLVLLVINFVLMAPSLIFPHIITSIIMFILTSLVNGFSAKNVASVFEEEYYP
jgi:predicted neutral ceramidase superfamily lipid hydrolase